ncbi:MAG: hypothetical protein GX567_13730 [Clostridia bacterium]|nr:hypothetical protein [Clostridia bacterium]
MKKLVVFKSNTGFTEKYARWIAEDLGCVAKPLKQVNAAEIASYDVIIYGGGIMAGMISDVDKIVKMNPKKLVVFATGATPTSVEYAEVLKKQNKLEDTPVFYYEGGLALEKLNFIMRGMLNMAAKGLAKKEDKTPEDEIMLKQFGQSYDHSNRDNISELVNMLKEE